MEILNFIFTDILHFVGTCFLIWLIFEGIEDIIKAFKRK